MPMRLRGACSGCVATPAAQCCLRQPTRTAFCARQVGGKITPNTNKYARFARSLDHESNMTVRLGQGVQMGWSGFDRGNK